ncbi:hypothetical protein GCM10017691_52940 [Pseudonocardia petroleophila]|uniref:Type VII secretion integral membrane protein EccD n=1 Tax=Pseudonocardia petroleophila TaxID=37331 RepID=A0A7G7MP93_9PSEU|nr:type VII secretion integral membrane protein EccD [Pseudonocardia petroleophila]QNG54604.1 type VII secretion integral membrane protein EccD [Pseudonocardia petroleophila]
MPTDPAPAYTRLTVLAPRTRVDVALPADVPLGELVPMVLELVGEPGPGHRPLPWRLTGATGGPLHPAATLDELGVLDGELLRIGPDAVPPPAPVFDDPVDALAAGVGRPAGPAGLPAGPVVTVLLACSAAAVLAGAPAGPWAVGAALVGGAAAVAALARAAAVLRRPDGARPGWDAGWVDEDEDDDGHPAPGGRAPGGSGSGGPGRGGPGGEGPGGAGPGPEGGQARAAELRTARHRTATTAALAAVPLAAGAGAAATAGLPGAAGLLLAVTAAGVAAAAGQAVLRRVTPVLVGVVVAAVPVAISAVLHLRLGMSPAVLSAGLGAAALLAGPLLPRAALRLSGLPGPVVPTDAGELTGADDGPDLLPPAELSRRSDLARGYLTGLVGGCAVVAAASVVPAAAGGGWAGPVLGAVVVAVLGLRSRGFADPAPARALLACSAVAGVALAGYLATVSGGPGRLLVGVLAVAGAGVAVAVGEGGRPPSPVLRRAVDVLEGVLVASAAPLALGAMGLFALVRGL